MTHRKSLILFLVFCLICTLAPSGLADWQKSDHPTTVSVVILGGVDLTLVPGWDSYDFGSIPGLSQPDLTKTIILEARCNEATYQISMQATPISPAGVIQASNLVYTAYTVTAPPPATLPRTQKSTGNLPTSSTIIINDGTCTAGTWHPVELHLTGLAGNEPAGTYTSTVTFTISTP